MPEERIYVIPLRKAKRVAHQRRAKRAAKLVREFLKKHMKSDEIKPDQGVNRKIWECGAKHPPSKIRVRVVKQDDGSVEATIAG